MKRLLILCPLLVVAALLLVTCKADFTAEIYLRDLLDVANGDIDMLLTNAMISMESPGSSNEESAKQMLAQNLRDAGNFRNESRDYTNFIITDIKVPVVRVNAVRTTDLSKDLCAVIVSAKDDGSTDFGLWMNQRKFNELEQFVKDEYWASLSIMDFELSLNVNNDTRRDVSIELWNLYANQEPIVGSREYKLSQRDLVRLKFSDVLRDFIYVESMSMVGTIKLDK